MKKLIKLVLVCGLFSYTFSSIAQVNCTASLVAPVTLPNGIDVTSTSTGLVNVFGNQFQSCIVDGVAGVVTPSNSTWLGPDNGPVNYTLNFSQPVNNLIVNITAAGENLNEVFNFTTNSGAPSINMLNGCFTVVTGNVITTGENSGDQGSGGGQFLITAPNSFTQLTISGPGGQFGSLFSFCLNSIVPTCPNNLTLTSPNDDINNSSPILIHRQAVNWISASNVIGFGNNAAQVGVVYHAGDFVDLTPGFDAINQSQFAAYIEGCTNDYVYKNVNSNGSAYTQTQSVKSLTISPNPSNSFIDLNIKNDTFNKIVIVTIEGKMVLDKTVETTNSYNLDISRYASGVYTVNVISGSGKQYSQKLIKN